MRFHPKNRLCVDGALEGEHTFTKTGRQRRATYATICQWIVDAWADISFSTVVQAFTKAGIITELPGNSSDTDSDNDEREPGMLDAVLAQLFNLDTEEECYRCDQSDIVVCKIEHKTEQIYTRSLILPPIKFNAAHPIIPDFLRHLRP